MVQRKVTNPSKAKKTSLPIEVPEVIPPSSLPGRKATDLFERLVPALAVASIALAFVVGVLWQKVNYLEDGGIDAGLQKAADNNDTAAGNVAADTFPDITETAKKAGVNEAKFKSCFDSKKYADKVANFAKSANDIGIQGTPGNVVLNDKGQGWLIPGALPYESSKEVIEVALGRGDASKLTQIGISQLTNEQMQKFVKVDPANDHVAGSKNPKIYLVEYSDYQCPFCKNFHVTAQKLVDNYQELAWVYRHLPLEQLHPNAMPAALASECVAELGGNDAFWKFTDAILSAK